MQKRKWGTLLLAVCCLAMSACGAQDSTQPPATAGTQATRSATYSADDTWAIYWYLCGSDLESEYGAATSDLQELMEVTLPENVQIIIETGGASAWQNDQIDPNYLERYCYAGEELTLLEQQPSANMGDSGTLTDFLSFCAENYPADHTAVLFWNHGGGSVTGAAFDELYENDSLTLDEMYTAFDGVYELSTTAPPFELVGFDTCLMATIDTAYTYADIARYLVASEELEPGNGWNYTGWAGALAENPGMDGAQLGKEICDAYVTGCQELETDGEITLSVIDLQKLEPLITAYDAIGAEALAAACADPIFFSEFGRNATSAESYGGNTPDEGYTNMVDLGDLVRNSASILPQNAQAVLDGLEHCVVYKVNGPYRTASSGLSCYYSFDGDIDNYNGFTRVGASEPFKYLYGYELGCTLSEEATQYISDIGYEQLQDIPMLETDQSFPLSVDENANATLTLGAETANLLKGVYFQLCYVDVEEDLILMLGRDNDIVMDWENGVFKDNFRGVWGAIDDNLCYMEIVYEGEDYNLYTVPILLNGEEYNLRVAYSYTDEAYSILGARKGLDDAGMADKNLIQLKPGDEITTLHYMMTLSGPDEDPTLLPVDTFTVTETTAFAETDMGDGTFMMMFELVDAQNQSVFTDMATFTVEGDTITTEA